MLLDDLRASERIYLLPLAPVYFQPCEAMLHVVFILEVIIPHSRSDLRYACEQKEARLLPDNLLL